MGARPHSFQAEMLLKSPGRFSLRWFPAPSRGGNALGTHAINQGSLRAEVSAAAPVCWREHNMRTSTHPPVLNRRLQIPATGGNAEKVMSSVRARKRSAPFGADPMLYLSAMVTRVMCR